MTVEPKTRYTYADLERFPEDNVRREIIDGDLFVTASPVPRHQWAVAVLIQRLLNYAETHGGRAYPAPLDIVFTESDVVVPDVLYMRPEHLAIVGPKYVQSAPDLAVEVSSPSTRGYDLTKKLPLYQRQGVPELWFVDLEAERVEVSTLHEGAYGTPAIFVRGDSVRSSVAPGFAIAVDELLGPPEEA